MGTAPFSKCYYHLAPARIGLLRFLLEGYDGLITLRTLDPRGGLVECAFPPTRQSEALDLLSALTAELGMQPATTPPEPQPGLATEVVTPL